MTKTYSDIEKIIDELISSIGSENVVKLLRAMKAEKVNSDEFLYDAIISIVAQTMGMTIKDIRNNQSHIASRARMICFTLMNKHTKLSTRKIGDVMDKDGSFVNKQINRMNTILEKKMATYENAIKVYNISDNRIDNLLITIKTLPNG